MQTLKKTATSHITYIKLYRISLFKENAATIKSTKLRLQKSALSKPYAKNVILYFKFNSISLLEYQVASIQV